MASLLSYIPSLWIALSLFTSFITFQFVIYPALFSPLCKVPNAHPLAPWTPLWILRKRFKGGENLMLYETHQKLGPVIRLGPNEISVNSYFDGLRVIYNGNFDKHQWYANVFSNYRIPNTFCIKESKPHTERKRLFANIYSKSYLQGSKDMLEISKEMLLNRIMPIFQVAAKDGSPVEVLEFGAAIGMDFTCAYLFGLDAGSDFIRDSATRKQWLDSYEDTKNYFTWVAELILPVILLKLCGINILPASVFQTIDDMGNWNLKMCKDVEAAQASGKHVGSTRPLVYEQMAQALEKVDAKSLSHPKDMIIASEMLDHILAGHETTAITLTYLMYELSRNPVTQAKLRAEVRSLSPSLDFPPAPGEKLPSVRAIDTLPLLDAVLQETLRRYPAAAGAAPRVTPHSGTSIGKYAVSGGVRISCNQYSLHRNAEVFPEPEEWKPERWIDVKSKEHKEDMRRWFWAFGSGPRTCLGVHFATQEIKLVVAAIYTNYETVIEDAEGIEPKDGFVGRPKGNKLLLKLKRVD